MLGVHGLVSSRGATGDNLRKTSCVGVKWTIGGVSWSVGEVQYCCVVSGNTAGLEISVGRNALKAGKAGDQLSTELLSISRRSASLCTCSILHVACRDCGSSGRTGQAVPESVGVCPFLQR